MICPLFKSDSSKANDDRMKNNHSKSKATTPSGYACHPSIEGNKVNGDHCTLSLDPSPSKEGEGNYRTLSPTPLPLKRAGGMNIGGAVFLQKSQ